ETFSAVQKLTGYSGKPKYSPEREGDIKHSLADISRAQKSLGYAPKVNFEEGLRRTVAWYRTQMKLAVV
ncbi:MAG: LPS biosynthesis protein WbpP, partial [Acidobacteria bacterium]